MSVPCRIAGCPDPAQLVCERCTRHLCGPHYGPSAFARCLPCFVVIVAEQGTADELAS